MADYSKTIKIRAEHVTITQSLRPSTLLRFLQEISIEHTEELGMPRQFTLDKGLLWVVAKQHIEILRLPRYESNSTHGQARRCTFCFPVLMRFSMSKGI